MVSSVQDTTGTASTVGGGGVCMLSLCHTGAGSREGAGADSAQE